MEDPNRALPPGPTFLERRGITPVMFGTFCVLFFFTLYQVVGTAISLLIFGMDLSAMTPATFRIMTGSAQILLLLVPTLLVVRLATWDPPAYLRLDPPTIGEILVPLVGIFSLQQMLQVYLVFQENIPLPPEIEKLVDEMKTVIEQATRNLLSADTPSEFLFVALIVAVIPAVSEEFLFRGLIQRSFERGVGPVRGIITTGIIFGAFHMNPFSMVPLVALGMYLGFLAYRSGSVWTSVVAHFFNNFIAVAALYFGLGEEAVVTGDPQEMGFGMLMATFWFSGVIFLLSTYYFLHLTKNRTRDPRHRLL
jgi:membrane protease YdiL (CAAX protease family)